MKEMLIHTATLKYSDIHATSCLQSLQSCDTTRRWATSSSPWAMVMY